MQLNITEFIDEAKCYEYLRSVRWSSGVKCPKCGSFHIRRDGAKKKQPYIYHYECGNISCGKKFDDRTGTIFSGSSQALKVWILVMWLLGLNLSNNQIAGELDICIKVCNRMIDKIRIGIVCKQEEPILEEEVEIDEVYIVAGHKGQPDKVKEAGRKGRRRRLKGQRGRGTLANEKPPILGMVQRGGELIMRMLPNVQQVTIKPLITRYIAKKTLIYTDEYNIYNKLEDWEYNHKTVCHSKYEYARDDDGDGFYEVHVNTQEGICLPRNLGGSLLRSWLRPHRGVSQQKLPLYIGFFQFLFNVKKRGRRLLPTLFETILGQNQREIEDFNFSL